VEEEWAAEWVVVADFPPPLPVQPVKVQGVQFLALRAARTMAQNQTPSQQPLPVQPVKAVAETTAQVLQEMQHLPQE